MIFVAEMRCVFYEARAEFLNKFLEELYLQRIRLNAVTCRERVADSTSTQSNIYSFLIYFTVRFQ